MAKVAWSGPAQADFDRILKSHAEASEAYASALGSKIWDKVRVLEFEPLFGSELPERGNDELRELLVLPYRVVYTIDRRRCTVVGIFHFSEDVDRALARRLPPR